MQQAIIEAGDSLYTLAYKFYGDETKWRYLGEKINRTVFDPLIAGEKIQLPDKSELFNFAETIGRDLIQTELKKRYPALDLSGIKNGTAASVDGIKIIDWIL